MRMYSVSEAIGPAWERTKFMLRTGRWGTNFKMALVVLLAEMGGLLLVPVQSFLPHRWLHTGPVTTGTHLVAALSIGFGVVFTVVYALAFFFGSRMQLTFFDMVLTRSHTVAPLWARHRHSFWRWMAIKLVPSALLLVGMVPYLLLFLRMQHGMAAHPAVDPNVNPQAAALAQLLAMKHAFAVLIGSSLVYMLLVGPALLIYAQMRDFVLPYLAIDQLSVGEACSRWLLLWRTYPGQMVGYLFFRLLLLLASVVALYLSLILAILVPIALAVVLGVVLHLLVHGTAGTILLGMYAALAAVAVLVWYLVLTLFGLAAFGTFFQCYSLYFLGGRDPRIGALLEPESAIPVWTPPPSAPHDSEDGSGPDFPADPALA